MSLDLFDEPPEPPTGPAAEVPSPGDGSFRAYLRFRNTAPGQQAWAWIVEVALTRYGQGERRISPRTLVAEARDVLKVRINDHFSPWIADDLVVLRPELLDVIERRKRRKAKVA